MIVCLYYVIATMQGVLQGTRILAQLLQLQGRVGDCGPSEIEMFVRRAQPQS